MYFSNIDNLKRELEKGNTKAFSYLIEKYHHPLSAYIFSLCKSTELTKDIVQNTFVSFWRKRENISSIESLQSFLYKSAYHHFVNAWRKESKEMEIKKIHAASINSYAMSKDSMDLISEKANKIMTAAENLPSRCKEVFFLSKKEGLTNQEIAEFLNLSVRTVETQISKAYKILRREL